MILKLSALFILYVFGFTVEINSQEFGTGLLLDEKYYENCPQSAPLMRSDFINLPDSFSLKQFTPLPGNQEGYSTCAGWATAYGGRTVIEAIRYNWSGEIVNSNAFSPSFIYNQIRTRPDCDGGTSLTDALDIIKNEGSLKFNEFGYDCNRTVTQTDKENAGDYKIIEYREVANRNSKNKISSVKKSLSESKPVVIAIDCPSSFQTAGDVWTPVTSDYKYWGNGHAILVIGYNDSMYGGAFEIMNSWGEGWGNDGYTWIRYNDFDYYCVYAFEMIDNIKLNPGETDLSGSLLFRRDDGEIMKVKTSDDYFKMTEPYPSGTKFELIISNNQPAYVYSFSSDLTYKTYKIFPFTKNMSALLPYKSNNVAIPDENSYNMLDETTGKSYFCFLYSKEKLDIDNIIQQVSSAGGNMWERIASALGNKIIKRADIRYDYESPIKFSATSRGKSVLVILIEIEHI